MEPTWHEIRAAAADIQTRAAMFGGHWSDILANADEALICIEDEDRVGITNAMAGVSNGCDACHMASWSPAYLHVTNGIIDGWLKGKPTKTGVNEQDAEPAPEIANRRVMQELWFRYLAAESHLRSWELQGLSKELGMIQPEAKERAKRWARVAEQADLLSNLAASRKLEGMKEAYKEMTQTCLSCHARNVGGREILIPMAWD